MAVLAIALPMLGATPSEFYAAMLRKGIAAHDAGRFDAAVSPLRVAAFGTVESVEHYQTAHVYLALTYDRLGEVEQARSSARRVVAAQRIEERYPIIALPAATRTSFDALVKRLLTAADVTSLGRSTQPQAQPATVTTTTRPPVQTASTTTPSVNSTTTTSPPQTIKPEVKPQPVPPTQAGTNHDSSRTTTTTTTNPPRVQKPAPVENKPAPATTKPAPATTKPAPTPPKPAPVSPAARFAAAEQALTQARLGDAREIYRELLVATSLQRGDILRVAEGLYRARDFGNALRAFERLGALRNGEQPYRYYIAVALYETGQYRKAKQELTAVLPHIEETPDVTRYRVKIENAIN